MADNFSGSAVKVVYDTLDISGAARSVTVTEAQEAPGDIDVTHRGDAAKVVLEGLAGAPKTTVKVDMLDETEGGSPAVALTMNTIDTLFIYPEGEVHGHQLLTVNNARFYSREQTVPYDGAVAWTLTFEAPNTVTYSTYNTA